MRSLVKRATAAAVSTMGRETESSHASDSGVGTKNSSLPGSRRRRLARSRSATRIRRRSLGEASPANAICLAAAPPRRSADRSIAAASTPAGDSRGENGYQIVCLFFWSQPNGLICLLPNLAHVCPHGISARFSISNCVPGLLSFLSSQFYFFFLKNTHSNFYF